ncbi:hypothetical protein G7046_g2952 [Stylonectria norvegica]|nr:hypothetical protein G7046_g2952 [Stylonectria norvegica]
MRETLAKTTGDSRSFLSPFRGRLFQEPVRAALLIFKRFPRLKQRSQAARDGLGVVAHPAQYRAKMAQKIPSSASLQPQAVKPMASDPSPRLWARRNALHTCTCVSARCLPRVTEGLDCKPLGPREVLLRKGFARPISDRQMRDADGGNEYDAVKDVDQQHTAAKPIAGHPSSTGRAIVTLTAWSCPVSFNNRLCLVEMALWEAEDYGIIADRACWAMFAVTTVIVILRICCRVFFGQGKLGGLGSDDYITVFCVLITLVTCIVITIGSSHGLGRHMLTLEPDERVQALKWNVIISSILIWTFSLPKFAIIAILKRILDYGLKTTIVFWGLAISSQACILATSIWWFKQCDPVEYGWDRSIDGTCSDVSVLADLGYFTSAYSAFLDIFFALYPIPFIMRLNMPLKSRIAVSTALGLSVLACIISIYKLTIFGDVFKILNVDPTYPVPYLDILGLAEGCILIVCASLPTLGPLFRLARGKLTTLNSSRGRSEQPGTSNQGIPSENSDRWANLRGHKLDDPEHGSTGMGSSVDDIPLVSSSRDAQRPSNDIYKTVEVTVDSVRHPSHRVG